MKTFLFIILLEGICSIMTSTFSSTYKCLVLQHTDGTQTAIGLYKEPRITFDAKSLIIHSPVLELSFLKEDILKYTFEEDVETSIETILTENDNLYIDGQNIIISGEISISEVSLYDITGRKIPVTIKKINDGVQVSLISLPQNIYILKVGDKSIKFNKL